MSSVFTDGRPLTDDEFLALGETRHRAELFDGSLLLSARGAPRHQHLVSSLATSLRSTGTHVLTAVNVRLRPGRIMIPDVVVTSAIDFDAAVVEAASVLLVAEVVEPSGDNFLKLHCCAESGIPWYLLVEQETGALHLYRRVGDRYKEQSVTNAGQALELEEPVKATILPEDLLPPG